MTLSLHKLTEKNVWPVMRLKVSEAQNNFVASNMESVIEAYVSITNDALALPLGIHHDTEGYIGFVMLGYGFQEGDPELSHHSHLIWRFMIAEAQQGKGYGKEAMHVVFEYIRTSPLGEGDGVWLSYESNNVAAQSLYARCGFKETGDICDGEVVAYRTL